MSERFTNAASPPAPRPALVIPPNSPRNQMEHRFRYESNFDIIVKLQCANPPCKEVAVRIKDQFTVTTGEILIDACSQLKLTADKYDLYYNTYNLTDTRLHMKYTGDSVHELVNDENFRFSPGMEFNLVRRPAGGLFGCIGGVCARDARGGTRRRGRGQKRTKRQTRRR